MAVDIFHWRSLTQAITQIKPVSRLLRDKVFKRTEHHASEDIDIDLIVGGQKIAPFVTPVEEGAVVAKLGQTTRTIKAPRIRLKNPLHAKDLLTTRAAGGQLYVASVQELEDYQRRKVALEQQELKNMTGRTEEWMCAQALTGTLSVAQDNLAFEIDYGIPDDNQVTLEGDDLWSAADTGTPVDDIRTWKRLIEQALGYNADVAFIGSEAADAFLANSQVQTLLDNRRISIGQLSVDQPTFLGTIAGVDIYEYNGGYDAAGTFTPFIAVDQFVLVATEARFTVHYGLIIDLDAGAQVIGPFFSKSWTTKDPSARWILAESRPLPVPEEPEAVVIATVV